MSKDASTLEATEGTEDTTTKKPRGKKGEAKKEEVSISPPNFKIAEFEIVGSEPLVINAFSEKARQQMHDTQAAGSTAKKGAKREKKDFEAVYEAAKHVSHEGWCGIPTNAFHNAMISACRLVKFHMTISKLALRTMPDGYDRVENVGLVRITEGEPVYREDYVRNATGVVDLRARPMWLPGWKAKVRIRFDADLFTLNDVTNLLMRAGAQVGICEGRPDSKKSSGMAWGLFEVNVNS